MFGFYEADYNDFLAELYEGYMDFLDDVDAATAMQEGLEYVD